MSDSARDLLLCAAALLDQGRTVDRLSRLLTAGALVGILLHPAMTMPPPRMLAWCAVVVAIAGLAEAYFAVRVGIDAALFHQVAGRAPGTIDFAGTDAALIQLGLLPVTKLGRPAEARVAGARWLFRLQVFALVTQVLSVFVGAGIALLWR
jgi:hypothetical protein